MIEILTALGGALVRALPEGINLLKQKMDYTQEIKLLDRQVELEKTKGATQENVTAMTTGVEQAIALLKSHEAALTGQMQKTGFRMVDALNFLVRPLTTYYLLALYGFFKLATFMVAVNSGTQVWGSIIAVYSQEDFQLLCGVLGFWFMGRVFDKLRQ